MEEKKEDTLFSAYAEACMEFYAPAKNGKGRIGNQEFYFATFRDIMQVVRHPLAKRGISVLQLVSTMGGKTQLELRLVGHGDSIKSTLEFEQPANPKEFGALVSYMRRYQLQTFFCIEGDPDLDEVEEQPKAKAVAAKPTQYNIQAAASVIAPNRAASEDTAMAIQELAMELKWSAVQVSDFMRANASAIGGKTRLALMTKSELQAMLELMQAASKESKQ